MASMKVERAPISTEDVKQPQLGTQATMRNSTLSQMTLTRYHSWSGTGFFPITIEAGGLARFNHLRGNAPRSKGAVVYAGRNKDNSACSWILAWDAPADTNVSNRNKIYMACGSTSSMDTITMSQIMANLDRSTSTEYNTASIPAKTKAVGKIDDYLIPNSASLESDFTLLP